MLNIQNLVDDARCYATVRELRWPDGVTCCPHCASQSIAKRGHDDTQPQAKGTSAGVAASSLTT